MIFSHSIFFKEELTNLPFCFLTPAVWHSLHFLEKKRSSTNIPVESEPTFKNCFSDITFLKTFFSFFFKKTAVFAKQSLWSLFVTKIDISLPSFIFSFYCFSSSLEWFRYNLQKTFLTYIVALYLLYLLDLYKNPNSNSYCSSSEKNLIFLLVFEKNTIVYFAFLGSCLCGFFYISSIFKFRWCIDSFRFRWRLDIFFSFFWMIKESHQSKSVSSATVFHGCFLEGNFCSR